MRVGLPLLAALALAGWIIPAGAAAAAGASAAPAGDVTTSQALATFEQTHPELLIPSLLAPLEGQQVAPSVQVAPDADLGTSVAGTLNDSQISGDPSQGLSVGSPDGSFGFVPTDLGSSVSAAAVVNGVAVLFANRAPSTDALLRPTPLGVREFLMLRGPDAPGQFSWQVSVGPDQELQQLADGSVAIANSMLSPTPPAPPTPASTPIAAVTAANNLDPLEANAVSGPQEDQVFPDAAPEVPPSAPVTVAQTPDLGHGCLAQVVGQLVTGLGQPPLLGGILPVVATGVDCPPAVTVQLNGALHDLLAKLSGQPQCTLGVLAALQGLLSGIPPPSVGSCGELASEIAATVRTVASSLGGPADTGAAFNVASQQVAAAEQQTGNSTAVVISAPHAVDAAGNTVPVSLTVHGDQITMNVARSAISAYPILVDRSVTALSAVQAAARRIVAKPLQGLSDLAAVTFTDTPNLSVSPPRTPLDVVRYEAFKTAPTYPVRTARLVLPWNLNAQTCFKTLGQCPEDQWVTNVEHEGFSPFLVLSGQGGHGLPAGTGQQRLAAYRAAFTAIVDHFERLAASNGAPPIRAWQSWNEPDNRVNFTQTVPTGARLAADFWREAHQALATYCTSPANAYRGVIHGCTVVAGEFASAPHGDYSRGGYIYTYAHEVISPSGRLPAVAYPTTWGYHAYVDLENGWRTTKVPYSYPRDLKKECTTDLQPGNYRARLGYAFQQTDCFVNFFAGVAHNGWDQGSTWHHPHTWLDEQGDALRVGPNNFTTLDARFTKTGGDPTPKVLNPNYPNVLGDRLAGDRQVAGGQEFRGFSSRYNGKVQRIYYYAWGPGGNPPSRGGFDSALLALTLAPLPSDVHPPRPVYCVLTFEPLATCTGSRTAQPEG